MYVVNYIHSNDNKSCLQVTNLCFVAEVTVSLVSIGASGPLLTEVRPDRDLSDGAQPGSTTVKKSTAGNQTRGVWREIHKTEVIRRSWHTADGTGDGRRTNMAAGF